MEQAINNYPSVTQAASKAYASALHMVTDHLLVGDFKGFRKGILDYIMNQIQLGMFHFVFTVCYFYTQIATFWLNDEGVTFYRCYKNFPAHVVFY